MCANSGGILSALGLHDADSAYEFSEEGSPHSPALSSHSAFSAFTGAPCSQTLLSHLTRLCNRIIALLLTLQESAFVSLMVVSVNRHLWHAVHHLRHCPSMTPHRGCS